MERTSSIIHQHTYTRNLASHIMSSPKILLFITNNNNYWRISFTTSLWCIGWKISILVHFLFWDFSVTLFSLNKNSSPMFGLPHRIRTQKEKDELLSNQELKNAFNYLGSRVPGLRTQRALSHANENGDG